MHAHEAAIMQQHAGLMVSDRALRAAASYRNKGALIIRRGFCIL